LKFQKSTKSAFTDAENPKTITNFKKSKFIGSH